MAISKESKESKIVFRKPFDLQEAVILLDVYLTFNKKGASTNAAAKIASQRLRALAVSRGMEIDDSFRSVLGIRNRLDIIGCVYEGTESKSNSGTRVFREAVELYKNNRKKFEHILSDFSTHLLPEQSRVNRENEGSELGQMEEHFNAEEQAFLSWLPSVMQQSIIVEVNVPTFRKWIQDVLKANNLHRIIYIFDEFSEFVDENSSQLKTFEDVTEAPDINHFYLVPVTHKEPVAFLGENAPGAKRARDRFYFRDLRMPNDIAFKLAGHAMKENEGMKQEWKNEKDKLWSSISTVVDRFDDPETSAAYVSRESFYNILPIHPMAAFLLKFLAEHARSNQRSIFEYLKGSADGREFQEFVAKGGPSISSAQFLTPDYLWKYFMERSDAGQSREITDIKLEYDRIVSREFRNYGDEQAEIRVLKTVMLFSLLSRLASDGHKRLLPTVENVELSFRGDGTIMDVRSILTELANEHHCFSIVDGNIDLYSSTIGGKELEDKVKDCMGKFHELLHEKCEREFDAHTRNSRAGFSGNRFDIRVSDESHTTLANISPATRDKFSQNLAKDDGSICLSLYQKRYADSAFYRWGCPRISYARWDGEHCVYSRNGCCFAEKL